VDDSLFHRQIVAHFGASPTPSNKRCIEKRGPAPTHLTHKSSGDQTPSCKRGWRDLNACSFQNRTSRRTSREADTLLVTSPIHRIELVSSPLFRMRLLYLPMPRSCTLILQGTPEFFIKLCGLKPNFQPAAESSCC
jgi:hypothetical protein